jgi:hypothetical protein
MNTSRLAFGTAMDPHKDASRAGTTADRWEALYRVAGWAALLIAVISPSAVVIFMVWPPPLEGTAVEWFALLHANSLRGLLSLDLLFMMVYALLIPVFLALYVSLRQASESVMATATALALVGVAVYFSSNPAFEMLSLSEGYAAATTDAQRAVFLAAGQGVLATFQGTAFKVSYLLESVAGVLIAGAILRSVVFSKATAYARLLASVLGLGLFLPVVGVPLALFSVVLEWVWYVLIARRFLQLGRGAAKDGVRPVSPRTVSAARNENIF